MMAFLSKLKDIFYDKVEVDSEEEMDELEEPIKPVKETREEKPRVEEIKSFDDELEEMVETKEEEPIKERDLFRSDKPFTFTELEDDEDLPPRKSVLDLDNKDVRPSAPVIEDRNRYESPRVDAPRVFKPTPVISPIYGILDKDYKKEEIREKGETSPKPVVSATTTYDSVRRKAYGTLEDDLEDTLNSMNKMTTSEVNNAVEDDVNTADLEDASKTLAELNEKTQKIENLINRIEEASDELDRTMSIGELEDTAELENFETDENKTVGTLEPEDKTMTDSTLEHDLFNLIDSMYDDKEE